jgi:regulator of sirC expression with transglutaminase-like and TPR domain
METWMKSVLEYGIYPAPLFRRRLEEEIARARRVHELLGSVLVMEDSFQILRAIREKVRPMDIVRTWKAYLANLLSEVAPKDGENGWSGQLWQMSRTVLRLAGTGTTADRRFHLAACLLLEKRDAKERASRLSWFFVFLLLASSPATPADLGTRDNPRSSIQAVSSRLDSVQDFLSLPEKKIDIGLYALVLAKEIYSDIDVAAYSAKIDALADRVRQLAGESQDPDRRVRCLNTVIFLNEKYRGSRDAVFTRDPQYFYLNRLLDTKLGNCFTMPLLYVAVGQRLGWPMYPVSLPDHYFARYVDPAFHEQKIEATSGGAFVTDERYAKDFMVSKTGRRKGTYLRTMTYREFLGSLVGHMAVRHAQSGNTDKAIAYLTVATKLNPRDVGAWANLVAINRMMAKRSSGAKAKKYFAMAVQCDKKLKELGFVAPWDVPLTPSMGGQTASKR